MKMPRLHTGAASDRLQTTETLKLPANPEVVWQQPRVSSINQYNVNTINSGSPTQYNQETKMTTLASQTSPPKVVQTQNHVIATEQPPESQTGNGPVPFLSCSSSCPIDIQKSRVHND